MDYRRDFLELARVFEMYGRSETKLDNQFIEYATKKIYHVLTGKDDLVVHCSDEMGVIEQMLVKVLLLFILGLLIMITVEFLINLILIIF